MGWDQRKREVELTYAESAGRWDSFHEEEAVKRAELRRQQAALEVELRRQELAEKILLRLVSNRDHTLNLAEEAFEVAEDFLSRTNTEKP